MTRTRLARKSVIWLTGATSGIGNALAKKLVDDGHRLIATGRDKSSLDELHSLSPSQIKVAAGDITDDASLDSVAQTLKAESPLNMAIFCAGTCEYIDVQQYDSATFEKNIVVNVIGTSRCIERALPHLREARQRGEPATIVIVGSSAWWFPFGRAEGYGASKAALAYLAHSLRADLAAEGIDVVLVSPGFVETPLTDRNDFPMPFKVSASDATDRIFKGLIKGRDRIDFPGRFVWSLRLVSALPSGCIDWLAAKLTRKAG